VSSSTASGFQQLLTSPATNAVVKGTQMTMAERANAVPSTTQPAASEPYYEVQDGTDEKRARYRVRTASERAAKHEARTQALQRNI
jgi:hypothetical protein